MRFILLLSCFWLSFYSSLFSQILWQRTNGPLGGDVNALVTADTGTIIAGTRLGGLFRSTDGGQNWTHLEDSPSAPFLFNGVFDMTKNSQGHLFAATARGVYRSTDNGDTWTAFDAGLTDRFIQSLAINSIDAIFAGSFSQGLFRSDDNGETWTAFNNGLTEMRVLSLVINSLGDVFAGTSNGIFFSSDNGDNWMEVSNGLENKFVFAIFATPEDSLLAGTSDGAFRSSNHGANWTKVISFSSIRSFARDTSNVLFAGGGGGSFFRSSDNGLTWEAGSDPLVFGSFEDFLVMPSGELLAATLNDGIVGSSDNGDTWAQQNAGLTAVDVFDMTQTPGGTIFAGGNDGIFRTNDAGENWSRTIEDTIGLDVRFIASSDTGRLFASLGGKLTISDNNGDSWFVADSSFTVFFPNSIAFGNDNDVYVGVSGQIFKSTDGGETWIELVTGIPSTSVQAMAVSGTGTVFAGTRSNGVFRSTDAGSTWVEVNNGIGQNFDMTAFLFQPNGDVLVSSFDGVFRSSDNGDTWEKRGNVPTLGVKDLGRDSAGNLFIAMRGGGVAISEDDGATWTNINDGLLHKDATALLIDPDDNLYTGTRGGGVFRGIRQTVSVEADDAILPGDFVLKQNYPNPFNPSTTISFEVPAPSGQKVTLAIFNVLGRRVRVLVNEKLAPGSHSIAWNGRDQSGKSVASGVYLYRLKAENYQVTKKLILMR